MRKVHPALFVDSEELDGQPVSDIADVLHLFDSCMSQLGDVDKPLLAGCKFNESTDRNDPCDRSLVYRADLRLEHDVADHLLCGKTAVALDRGNEYGAVLLYADLCPCLGLDLLNDLAMLIILGAYSETSSLGLSIALRRISSMM